MGSQTERNRGVYQGPGLSHLSTDKGGGCRHTRLGTCAWPEPSPLELLPSPSFVSLFRLDRPPSRLEGRQTALLSDLSTRVAGTECNLVNC